MKSNKQKDCVWMGFDILTEQGSFPRPTHIRFWEPSKFKQTSPEAPFHYSADALVGLSLVHLNPNLQNPFATPQMNFGFASEAWKALEPHLELYSRSQPRVQSLREHGGPRNPHAKPHASVQKFERRFSDIVASAIDSKGIDLSKLCDILEAIETLESDEDRPLLYNLKTQFSRETLNQMHYLHSMLFHLRALIAMDHNAHVQDTAHESAKVDSITDYLPKAEYVANDALLYWAFKKTKEELPKPAAEKMEKAFLTYSHNGACLIENLPSGFLKKMSWDELEETLYLVQMDWLLGTDTGLLFRLREEIYGLAEGYDLVFYPDLISPPKPESQILSVNVQVTSETLYPKKHVA